MKKMSVTYVMWCMWQDMEKFKMTVSFFQNGKKNNGKALISIKMLLFLETIIAPCADVPATRVSFCL